MPRRQSIETTNTPTTIPPRMSRGKTATPVPAGSGAASASAGPAQDSDAPARLSRQPRPDSRGA